MPERWFLRQSRIRYGGREHDRHLTSLRSDRCLDAAVYATGRHHWMRQPGLKDVVAMIGSYVRYNAVLFTMIGVTSAGEGPLTYWRQHDRLSRPI